jgi:hypothetical protein
MIADIASIDADVIVSPTDEILRNETQAALLLKQQMRRLEYHVQTT